MTKSPTIKALVACQVQACKEDDINIIDLINTPEPKRGGEVWVNVYATPEVGGVVITSNIELGLKKLACVRVSWTEGEGLEGICLTTPCKGDRRTT